MQIDIKIGQIEIPNQINRSNQIEIPIGQECLAQACSNY